MSILEAAEKAVAQLSPAELASFRRWFAEYDGEVWDAEIEADAAAGKLDALAEEAKAEQPNHRLVLWRSLTSPPAWRRRRRG